MSSPRFTVLMPTHYRPDVLGLAIQSVLNQTEKSFELLVVGDGAGPETAAVVQGFTDPRLKWFDLPKAPGFGYANRNIAMAGSQGELVAFAADDDLMLPDHLERLGQCFDDPQVQWACSLAMWVSTDGIAAPDLTNLDNADERRAFADGNSISGGSLVFRASAFPSRRVWPEHVMAAADWEKMRWLLREHGLATLRRLPVPTYFHFTAGRKGDRRHSDFPLLAAWLDVADNAPWWPEILRPALAGRSPQAAYLQAMQADPDYAARVRQATADVVNRVALGSLAPRWQVSRPSVAQLQGELDAMRNSTTWRLTAPLRRLAERFGRRRRG